MARGVYTSTTASICFNVYVLLVMLLVLVLVLLLVLVLVLLLVLLLVGPSNWLYPLPFVKVRVSQNRLPSGTQAKDSKLMSKIPL